MLERSTEAFEDLPVYLVIHKVFGWLDAKTQEFRCKPGHLGASLFEHFMNRQIGEALEYILLSLHFR